MPADKYRKDPEEELVPGSEPEPAQHAVPEKGWRHRHRHDEPFEVVIPLGNDRMKAADIRRTLKAEYAARYLEKLGASPTPANLNLIWKKMPIEKCKIQQVSTLGTAPTPVSEYVLQALGGIRELPECVHAHPHPRAKAHTTPHHTTPHHGMPDPQGTSAAPPSSGGKCSGIPAPPETPQDVHVWSAL